MSNKGYPSSQKQVTGVPSVSVPEFQTLQPMDAGLRAGMDTISRFAFRVDDPTTPRTAGANTGNPDDNGPTVIEDTATPALVGDFVRFQDGNAQYLEFPIIDVSTNQITLGCRLDTSLEPAPGDEFFILRYVTPKVDENGALSVSSGPIEFMQDGAATQVAEDTGTPANSIPLVVKVLEPNGVAVDFATEAKQDTIITALGAANTSLDAIEAVDFATEAKQDTIITALGAANTSLDAIEAIDFATEAKQDDVIAELQAANTELVAANASLDALEAVDFATEAKQDTQITELQDIEADVEAMSAKLPTTLGQAVMAASMSVVIASDQSPVEVTGSLTTSPEYLTPVDKARNDYASASVATSAYTELIASLTADAKEIEIYDSSGETLVIATGAASSELDQMYIPPGGGGRKPFVVASGTRISIRAVSANASSGEIVVNFFG